MASVPEPFIAKQNHIWLIVEEWLANTSLGFKLVATARTIIETAIEIMKPLPQIVGWVTDIHLNFVDMATYERFIQELQAAKLDAILLSGDISEAEDVTWQLQRLFESLRQPIYFVLGNHDFYHGSIEGVRQRVRQTCAATRSLCYLNDSPPVQLANDWVLCGEDGWADGRVGDYYRSIVRMNDFRLIKDLVGLDAQTRLRKLRRLGAESALRLSRQLRSAAKLGSRILVVTHIPPFRESCWYEGQQTDDNWAPFFVSGAVGWALKNFCNWYRKHEVLVLCGHTHHPGCVEILPNLCVWTGAAEYGKPMLYRVLDLKDASFPPAVRTMP